ncbi:BA75_00944T0 [Komagataella pastoris]|uniref:BA75_00944T0 n=1 Tax=Komagataella pastoris TaxID=4922 RepID=A0A1B2J527_PICPA|nr:BA75_00944T0 [Komagataella pastoris]
MTDFLSRTKEIQHQIDSVTTITELYPLRLQINDLFQHQGSHLQYDQKLYKEASDSLINELSQKKKLLSKQGKFRFSNRQLLHRLCQKQAPRSRSTLKDSTNTIRSHVNPIRTYQCIRIASETSVTEQHLDHVVLKVVAPSIHISNISNCILFLNIKGPIYMSSVKNCFIISNSYQLRLHEVTNSVVNASIAKDDKRITIENCCKLLVNPCVQVDDFNWPNNSQSPNFRFKIVSSPHERSFKEGPIKDGLPIIDKLRDEAF